MTRFEFFESGAGLIAVKIGVVPVSLLTKYDIYKSYREFLSELGNDELARKKTVDSSRYSYWTVVRAIYWFERDDSYKTHKDVRASLQIGAQTAH